MSYRTASPDRYELLKSFARENRLHMTPAENCLWGLLMGRPAGFRFKRQHIIFDFIADFCCLQTKLVIEVDGGYHSEKQQMEDDIRRTEILEQMGFQVVRFSNDECQNHTRQVVNQIIEICKQRNNLEPSPKVEP